MSRGATVIVGIFLALTLVSVYVNFVHLETASKAKVTRKDTRLMNDAMALLAQQRGWVSMAES